MREDKMRQRGVARPKTQSKKSTQDDILMSKNRKKEQQENKNK